MAGRLYRMAKVVSANPKSWGIVDANEISGFKRVAKLSDLYSIAECILSSSYGDGVTDGADAVGQIWHVSETNGDYKLTNWANRKSAAGWTKLSYGGDVSVPVKDVQVNDISVVSNGVAKISLENYATKNDLTEDLKKYIPQAEKGVRGGVAPLDRDNMIPLQYLGHLDMTVFTVVESLPTSDIENKVYLVKSSLTSDKNIYSEYIYTGNRNDVYDATKWEKLGEVAAKTDLSEYYKKTEVYNKTEINTKVTTLNDDIAPLVSGITAIPHLNIRPNDPNKDTYELTVKYKNGTNSIVRIKPVTNIDAGVMTNAQKIKLDGIAVGANKTIIDSILTQTGTNAVQGGAIYDAITTHKIGVDNLSNIESIIDGNTKLLLYNVNDECASYRDNDNSCYLVSDATTGDGIPKIYFSNNGTNHTSQLLRDIDVVALTDTELNEILK